MFAFTFGRLKKYIFRKHIAFLVFMFKKEIFQTSFLLRINVKEFNFNKLSIIDLKLFQLIKLLYAEVFSSYFFVNVVINTARKSIFSFSKCSEKMVFPKKSHWNMIFLLSSGKMAFLFPENMTFFLRTENER